MAIDWVRIWYVNHLRLGLPYDPINLAVAQQRVSQIRLDILSGYYDPSLVKYRGGESKPEVIGAVELFTRFIDWKTKRVQPRTLEKYRALAVLRPNHSSPSHPSPNKAAANPNPSNGQKHSGRGCIGPALPASGRQLSTRSTHWAGIYLRDYGRLRQLESGKYSPSHPQGDKGTPERLPSFGFHRLNQS